MHTEYKRLLRGAGDTFGQRPPLPPSGCHEVESEGLGLGPKPRTLRPSRKRRHLEFSLARFPLHPFPPLAILESATSLLSLQGECVHPTHLMLLD